MDLRVLVKEDAFIYRSLRVRALREDGDAFLTTALEYEQRSIEQVANQLYPTENRFTLGAFDGAGTLIGVVTCLREENPKIAHKAHVFAMYVAPEYRGKRVAFHLLSELIERARHMFGVRQLQLTVVESNVAAVRLYESLRFRTYGIEPNAMWQGDRYVNDAHMVLDFSQLEMTFEEEEGPLPDTLLRSVAELYDSVFGTSSDKFIEEMTQRNQTLYTVIAKNSDQVMGFKMGYREGSDRFYSWIGGVHPEARNRGVASELMRRQHRWCLLQGIPTVRTVTMNRWQQMLLLNVRHGFEIIGTYQDNRGQVRIMLEKRLVSQ